MATKKDICEEIEFAILCDAELTDKQKNHIENCQNCKALLSQLEQMKKDLGNLSVPGIKDGQIKDEVMKEIYGKTSAPIPKFKWTNHIGTAAAAVIILVAALFIKNPTDVAQKSNDTVALDKENKNVETHKILPQNDQPSEVIYYNTIESDSEIGAADASADSSQGGAMKTIPTSEDTARMQAVSPALSFEDATQDNVASTLSADGTAPINDVFEKKNTVLTEAITEDSAEADAEQEYGNETTALHFDGISSGNDNQAVLPNKEYSDNLVFGGVQFLDGEENFDYNISIANNMLSNEYPGYVLKREILDEQLYNNQTFIYIMSNLTWDDFSILIKSKNTIFVQE